MVSVSEYVPYKIHRIDIFLGQGYSLHKNILYQYNESEIKMENNGKNSFAGNSRHISIRYFFVKDCVNKEDFSIEYCNTSEMLTNFFTKPLQGSLFDAPGKSLWDGRTSTSCKICPTSKEGSR